MYALSNGNAAPSSHGRLACIWWFAVAVQDCAGTGGREFVLLLNKNLAIPKATKQGIHAVVTGSVLAVQDRISTRTDNGCKCS
jgi:hypothetical protein